MTKRKYPDRRLLVVSKRRIPSDDGLARLVAAMVLHQLEQAKTRPEPQADASAEDSA